MVDGDVEAALALDARRLKGRLAAALLCVGAALGCGLQAARAEVAIPDTPAGRVLARLARGFPQRGSGPPRFVLQEI